jgi:hypothetical protein
MTCNVLLVAVSFGLVTDLLPGVRSLAFQERSWFYPCDFLR